MRCFVKAGILLAVALLPLTARALDSAVVFGLTNKSINGANLTLLDYPAGLHVDNLSDYGFQGLSVRLGEAESGLYFTPQVSGQLNNSNFMAASAYGRFGGSTRRICSVAGGRQSFGTYPVAADFTPLGAATQVFQIFCDGNLIREETNSLGTVIFDTSSYGNLAPRVNPCWRAPDGSIGVLIEINTSLIKLPHGQAFGNRVFIKAVNPLFSVDYVSRVDVFGGGGLPNFETWGEALGIFQHPHAALGGAVFNAKLDELTVQTPGESGEDGVMVELDGASGYEMQLQPLALTGDALLQISALGVGANYLYHGREFIGPVKMQNLDGTIQVSASLGSSATNRVRIGIYNDGAFVGSVTNQGGVCGTIPAGDWTITSCGALPDSGSEHSSVFVALDQPVTFQPSDESGPFTGNQLRFSWHDAGPDNACFKNFQVQAAGVPAFVITGGSTTLAPPLQLSIVRLDGVAQVSWPYVDTHSYLEIGHDVQGTNWFQPAPGYPQVIGSRWQINQPVFDAGQQFFRLNNFCNIMNYYYNFDY